MSKELLFSIKADDKDVEWQYFRAGGKGGQNQNKTSSGARVIHHPSGARGESREERSQLQNRKAAWKRMVDTAAFKVWLAEKLVEGPTIEQRVEAEMKPSNLLVEVREDGNWVEKVI